MIRSLMKKTLSAVLTLILFVSILPVGALAEETEQIPEAGNIGETLNVPEERSGETAEHDTEEPAQPDSIEASGEEAAQEEEMPAVAEAAETAEHDAEVTAQPDPVEASEASGEEAAQEEEMPAVAEAAEYTENADRAEETTSAAESAAEPEAADSEEAEPTAEENDKEDAAEEILFDSASFAGQSYYITRGGWFLNTGNHLRTSDPGAAKAWTFVSTEDGSYYLKQGNKYLGRSDDADEWEIVSSAEDAGRFTVEAGTDGNIRIAQADAPNELNYIGIGTDPMDHKFEYARSEEDETGGTDLLLFQDIDLTGDEYILYTQGNDQKYYAITVEDSEEGLHCTATEVEIVDEDVNLVRATGDEELTAWKFDKQGAVKSNIYTTVTREEGEEETVYLYADGKTTTLSDSAKGFNISKRDEGDYGEGDLYRFVGSKSHTAPVYANGGFAANGTIDIRNAWFRLAKAVAASVGCILPDTAETLEAVRMENEPEEKEEEQSLEGPEAVTEPAEEETIAASAQDAESSEGIPEEAENPEPVEEPQERVNESDMAERSEESSAEAGEEACLPEETEQIPETKETESDAVVIGETSENGDASEMETDIAEASAEEPEQIPETEETESDAAVIGETSENGDASEIETDQAEASAEEPEQIQTEAESAEAAESETEKPKAAERTGKVSSSKAVAVVAETDPAEEPKEAELFEIRDEAVPLAAWIGAETESAVRREPGAPVIAEKTAMIVKTEASSQEAPIVAADSRKTVRTFSGMDLLIVLAGIILAAAAVTGSMRHSHNGMLIALEVAVLALIAIVVFVSKEDLTGEIRWTSAPSIVLSLILALESGLTALHVMSVHGNR